MSAEASSQPRHVIYPAEAEGFVRELRTFKISDIGSEKWSRQRERLEQLALQAVCNVSQQADEFVKEYLVSHDKIGILVHELLSLELWREKVFPLMLENSAHPTSGFPAYLVLYSEGTLASLLETALFYQESCECAGDSVLDLVDYCHRQLVALLAGEEGSEGVVEVMEQPGSSSEEEEEEGEGNKKQICKELREQEKTLCFSIAMKVISILQYITDHMDAVSLSVATRILNTHDLPCLLVSLLDFQPWTRRGEKGIVERYEDGSWKVEEERLKLGKTEGQVWLTLYKLLLDKDCQQKYDFTSAKKSAILQLRKYMSTPLLEQIPHLADLQRYLEQLSFMDPPLAHKDLILQQVPVIHDKLLKQNAKKWKSIAQTHAKLLLEPTPSQLQSTAKQWTTTSHLDIMEELMGGPPKCAACGGEATKRCSRCRNEWYCGRECQVGQWKKHKPVCDIIANAS